MERKHNNRMSGVIYMTGLQLKETSLRLSDDMMVKVTHFDFKEICFSHLNNKLLMDENNITFPNDNPCMNRMSRS